MMLNLFQPQWETFKLLNRCQLVQLCWRITDNKMPRTPVTELLNFLNMGGMECSELEVKF